MILDDLKLIEEQLNIVLPESYKNLMMSYPFQDSKFNTVKENLINEPEILIDVNQHFRTLKDTEQSLPSQFFIIGQNSNNSVFLIDLKNGNQEKVYFLDGEKKYNLNNLDKYMLSYNFKEFIELTRILRDVLKNPKHTIKKRSDWIISLRGLFSREQTVSY